MTPRPTSIRHLLIALAAVALALPASSVAAEPPAAPAGPQTETTTPAPAPEAPAPAAAPQAPQTETAPAGSEAAAAPKVAQQLPQGATSGGPRVSRANRANNQAQAGAPTKNGGAGEGEGTGSAPRAERPAPLPSGLTPSLPSALQSSLTGVPEFFIESFQIPPFLLPIFQAAGTAYGVPWQVLAAINEVETDYGRDLSVSSAGAEGWMQFLPAEWAQYGVDANGDGVRDPYNPADAIFAAARYLRAAGGETNIRAAIYSYNHSQAYVASVMLRAQLLGGTPSELLGAITGLTEARFPVHAAAHYSDGFATAPASGSTPGAPIVGTTIYAAAGSPVIAVQDGEIVQIGESPALGHFIVLRDAFGNRYTYARLGDIASLYPVLEPHLDSTVSSRISRSSGSREPAPGGPATAGAQPRSPISEGATVSGLALGAAATLESVPQVGTTTTTAAPAPAPAPASQPAAQVRSFRSGADEVFLHPLHTGVEVIAGTVLGHVGAATEGAGTETAPHILFQIRPAGIGAPLIDPKPILDGWVALENSSIFRAKGENPFLATSPTVGQVLLESKQQLEPQVLHDTGIRLAACGRQDVQSGRVDKRVLALLEYMSVSGLKPTVAGLRCAGATPAAIAAYAPARAASENIDITAINGIPVAGHQGPGSITDIAVRKLLMLQGAARPLRIVSRLSYRGAASAVASAAATNAIEVDYSPPAGAARAASAASTLTPSEWIKLVARLGEIPDPTVAAAPSAAAIPDESHAAGNGAEGGAGGNH